MDVNEAKTFGMVIENKISKCIAIMTKFRKDFDETSLMYLYNPVIRPYIIYCVHTVCILSK